MAAFATPARLAGAALAVLAAVVGLALVAAGGDAAAAQRKQPTVLGHTASTPRPNCPTPEGDNVPADRQCQAMGRVTGFQTSADGRHNPFKVRQAGRIVAWGVDISRPERKERRFFEEALSKSGPPSARLSILKPKEEGVYKLVKQSPVVALAPVLGNQPVFTLADPLKVKKGLIVALTTPTWISNLADHGASESDQWVASREQGECLEAEDLLERSRPQQGVGGERNYACRYDGARLLYRAYLAPRE